MLVDLNSIKFDVLPNGRAFDIRLDQFKLQFISVHVKFGVCPEPNSIIFTDCFQSTSRWHIYVLLETFMLVKVYEDYNCNLFQNSQHRIAI